MCSGIPYPDVFKEAEEALNIHIPPYLKKLLEYNGYDSFRIIADISEQDITDMESFARNILPSLLSEDEHTTFYGIFNKDVRKFQIVMGHRKLLTMVSKYCQKYLDLQHEKSLSNESLLVTRNSEQDSVSSVVLQNPVLESREPLEPIRSNVTENLTEENGCISKMLKNWIKNKCSDLEVALYINKFNEMRFTTKLDVSGGLVCLIQCFCKDIVKIFKQSRNKNCKPRWLCSNFHRHFISKHLTPRPKHSSTQNQIQHNEVNTGIKRYFLSTDTQETTSSKINIISNICLTESSNSESKPLTEGSDVQKNFEKIDTVTKPNFQSKWTSYKYQRSERRRRLREKNISKQPLITNYFPFIEQIQTLINEDSNAQKQFIDNLRGLNEDLDFSCSSELLKQLYDISQKNLNENKNHNRFNDGLKKFCLYLYYIGGRLLYETLYANMANILPSLSSLNRFASNSRQAMEEGFFDYEGLKVFLQDRNLPMCVWLSEDATRVTGKVEYEPKTNKIIGFVLPLENGIPKTDAYLATSAEKIQNYFLQQSKSNYAYVVMAQPVCANAPPYCLGIFGTDNKFTCQEVKDRWFIMARECKGVGINVLGISSDGDPRLLKAMRENACLPLPENKTSLNGWEWYKMNYKSQSEVYIQDTPHIATKLRIRILKKGIVLPIGNYTISVTHLQNLVQNVPKDQHLLNMSDFKAEDKMNFGAAERMSSKKVSDLLISHFPESSGTAQYLKIMRYIISSYMDKDLSILERVYRIWYCVFFLRIWRQWLKVNKFKTTDNFLSTNCYLCIELNAHSLIKVIKILQDGDNLTNDMFLPWLYNSQTCEKHFRATRSLTSTFSTVINFSIKDILRRTDRIQMIHNIMNDLKGTYVFPREQKKSIQNNSSVRPDFDVNKICEADLKKTVESALEDSIKALHQLGIRAVDNTYWNTMLVATCETYDENEIEEEMNESFLHESNDTKLTKTSFLTQKIIEDLESDDNQVNKQADQLFLDVHSIGNNFNEMIHLKQYSDKLDNSHDECGNYVRIFVGNNKTAVIKKSSLCWLLDQGKERVSTDRLRRFIQNTKYSHDSTKIPMLQRRSRLYVGDWCLFLMPRISQDYSKLNTAHENSLPNGIILGRILSFKYLSEKNQRKHYSLEYIALKNSKNSDIGCICTWYTVDSNGLVMIDATNEDFVGKVCNYKYTIPRPEIKTQDDEILLTIDSNILREINSKIISEADIQSAKGRKTNTNNIKKNSSKFELSSTEEDESFTSDDCTDSSTSDQSDGETSNDGSLQNQCTSSETDISVNDFIVVELATVKGRKKRFLAKVLSTNPCHCSFLRPCSKVKHTYVYPTVTDEANVELNEIVAKLPQPQFLRRGMLSFPPEILNKYFS